MEDLSRNEVHEIARLTARLDAAQQAFFQAGFARHRRNPTTALLLCVLLGNFGAHYFYFGRRRAGLLRLLFCWTLVPGVAALFEARTMEARAFRYNASLANELILALERAVEAQPDRAPALLEAASPRVIVTPVDRAAIAAPAPAVSESESESDLVAAWASAEPASDDPTDPPLTLEELAPTPTGESAQFAEIADESPTAPGTAETPGGASYDPARDPAFANGAGANGHQQDDASRPREADQLDPAAQVPMPPISASAAPGEPAIWSEQPGPPEWTPAQDSYTPSPGGPPRTPAPAVWPLEPMEPMLDGDREDDGPNPLAWLMAEAATSAAPEWTADPTGNDLSPDREPAEPADGGESTGLAAADQSIQSMWPYPHEERASRTNEPAPADAGGPVDMDQAGPHDLLQFDLPPATSQRTPVGADAGVPSDASPSEQSDTPWVQPAPASGGWQHGPGEDLGQAALGSALAAGVVDLLADLLVDRPLRPHGAPTDGPPADPSAPAVLPPPTWTPATVPATQASPSPDESMDDLVWAPAVLPPPTWTPATMPPLEDQPSPVPEPLTPPIEDGVQTALASAPATVYVSTPFPKRRRRVVQRVIVRKVAVLRGHVVAESTVERQVPVVDDKDQMSARVRAATSDAAREALGHLMKLAPEEALPAIRLQLYALDNAASVQHLRLPRP